MKQTLLFFIGAVLLEIASSPLPLFSSSLSSSSLGVEAKKRKCTKYPNSNDDRLIEGRFAGWKDKRNHRRCNRRGTWRRAKCWRNDCGKTRICRNQPNGNKPYCLCKSGWTGDRCETAVTAAPTTTPEPATLPPVTPTPTTPSPPTPVPITPEPPTPIPPTPVPTTTPVPPTPVPPTPVPPPTPAPLTPEPPTPVPPTPAPTTPSPPTPAPPTPIPPTPAPTTTTTTAASSASADSSIDTTTTVITTTAATPVPPTAPPSTTTPAPPTPTPQPPTPEPPGATPAPTLAPPPAEEINCVLDFSCVGNGSSSAGGGSSPPATPGSTIDGRTGQTLNSSVIVGEIIRAEWADEDVDSFVIESRAQYFGTRPMRFTGTFADDVASFLVDSINLLLQIITGELLLMTEYTIILENTTLSDGWALGADFVADLNALPNTYQADTAAYQSFLDKYGTYVVVGAQYGARLRRETDKTDCDNIAANSEARQNDMLQFAETGFPPEDGTDQPSVENYITGVAGGPSQDYLNQNGFAAWRSGVTTENAVPLEVEIIMIYNESIVVDPNKQNALEEAIEDRKPFEWPDLSTLVCGTARTIVIITIIVIIVLVIIGLLIPMGAIGAAIKALCKSPSANANGEFKRVESKKVEEVYQDKNGAQETPQ